MIGHPTYFEKYLSLDASEGRTVVKYIQFLHFFTNFFLKKKIPIKWKAMLRENNPTISLKIRIKFHKKRQKKFEQPRRGQPKKVMKF